MFSQYREHKYEGIDHIIFSLVQSPKAIGAVARSPLNKGKEKQKECSKRVWDGYSGAYQVFVLEERDEE